MTSEPTQIHKGLTDERFAFEVVRNLGDSVRTVSEDIRALRDKTDVVLEKVVGIEAHSIVERLAKLETKLERIEMENLKAKGLKEAASWFFQSPTIMWLAGLAVALYVWLSSQLTAK